MTFIAYFLFATVLLIAVTVLALIKYVSTGYKCNREIDGDCLAVIFVMIVFIAFIVGYIR